MDNGFSKEILRIVMEAESGEVDTNVIDGKFAMNSRPIAAQITIHMNNLFVTYNKKQIVKTFKEFLYNPETINDLPGNITIKSLINHYNIDIMKNWFIQVYGWKFEKVG